ncbi:MAG TPA: response regulator [Thermomicrobiales bacterium]|nr:response regulator [Thermomicrobiales bacterium]
MSQPVILLVEDDKALARRIAGAIETRILGSRLIHVTSGEEAVLWAGANDCSACLLDYDLPGIDGLETLARIHQRKPNVPVIMLSGAASEQVAVAAFRARVSDYIAKQPGFEQTVAQLLQQLLASAPVPTGTPVSLDGAGIPAGLAQLTYQNRLRVIGRQLDLYAYRAATLLEVAGGFLVRAAQSGSRTPEALEFLDQDFPQLLHSAYSARGAGEHSRSTTALLPTGYEDFLRALGQRLDSQFAEAVTVTELDSFVAVGGVAKVDASGQTGLAPLQWLLRTDEITYLLDDAFRRRTATSEPRRGSFLRRG